MNNGTNQNLFQDRKNSGFIPSTDTKRFSLQEDEGSVDLTSAPLPAVPVPAWHDLVSLLLAAISSSSFVIGRQVQLFLPTLLFIKSDSADFLAVIFALKIPKISCNSTRWPVLQVWLGLLDNYRRFRILSAGCMTPLPLFCFSDVPS